MFDTYPTKTEARRKAAEYTTPLNRLIDADDVCPTADDWSDVPQDKVREEAFTSAEIIADEHREMRALVDELAFRLWFDSLSRVSEDALSDDVSDWEMVSEHRVWPNQWDKAKLHEVMHEVFENPRKRAVLSWYRQDAASVVRGGLCDGSMPDV